VLELLTIDAEAGPATLDANAVVVAAPAPRRGLLRRRS
jgi:hypothetical protein